jgi:HEAT repeat protein
MEALGRLAKAEDRERVLDDLARMKAKADRRGGVAKSIQPLVAETNQAVRIAAIRALGVWGDKEQVPLLIDAMDHEDGFTRRAAAIALKHFPDERAIPVLVKRMSDSSCTGESIAALIAIGPAVEKSVQPALNSKDAFAQAAAIKVVKGVGTADSVFALRKIAATKFYPADLADEAIKAINARSKKK